MVRAWYMDNETNDQRLEHHRNPPKFIDLDQLFKITGVEYFQVISIPISNIQQMNKHFIYFQLNADTYQMDGKLDKIRKERGYSYEDEV